MDGSPSHREIQQAEHAVGKGRQVPGLQQELALGGLKVQSHGQGVQPPGILQGKIEKFLQLGLDALGGGVGMKGFHQPAPMRSRPEHGRIEGYGCCESLAEGLSWFLLHDSHGFLALEEQVPPARGEWLSAYDLSQAPDLEDGSLLSERARIRGLPHERQNQVVVGIENFHRHLLVPGLEDMEG